VINGLTYHCVLVRDTDSGELKADKQTKLVNFSAQIISETINDDGAEQTREFGVSAVQRNRPPVCVNVPVERFNSLDWIVERFVPRYVIQAGNGKRDHLRCAIQEMSGDDIPQPQSTATRDGVRSAASGVTSTQAGQLSRRSQGLRSR
jgi:hypothetical protein